MHKNLKRDIDLVQSYVKDNYKKCFREPYGKFKYPCVVPGSSYSDQLWDWDGWLTDVALAAVADSDEIAVYGQGCVLNFLAAADENGRIPINIVADRESIFDLKTDMEVNIHKPCLAQHALLVVQKGGNKVEWLKKKLQVLKKFLQWYRSNCFHEETGLYYWLNDFAIGIDNDPCVFYRPNKSTASIFLNCLMYGEFVAMAELCKLVGDNDEKKYTEYSEWLKLSIQNECWDERDGFYYSADILLKKVDPNEWLHSGSPRHWRSLPMRIGVWSSFLTMYYGIATEEQAIRMVKEHLLNEKEFNARYGVRSLSKAESRMYAIKNSGNPSCWIGPIWINVNYMTCEGMIRYGFADEAEKLAEKTIMLLGKDVEKSGEFHEYYDPDTGDGIRNQGFQSWNLLSYNMAIRLVNNNWNYGGK